MVRSSHIGFTATLQLSNSTTFSGYISVHSFKRALEDRATVSLYYENRNDKVANLHNSEISSKILDAIKLVVLNVDHEEQRYVRGGCSSDEELSLYDLLLSEDLSKQNIEKIKQVMVAC